MGRSFFIRDRELVSSDVFMGQIDVFFGSVEVGECHSKNEIKSGP
jgi:hypothetical protein